MNCVILFVWLNLSFISEPISSGRPNSLRHVTGPGANFLRILSIGTFQVMFHIGCIVIFSHRGNRKLKCGTLMTCRGGDDKHN